MRYILIFIIILATNLSLSVAQSIKDSVWVTFEIVDKAKLNEAQKLYGNDIYVSGTFNGWDAGDKRYILKKSGLNNYLVKIKLKKGDIVEYKFARQHWAFVEKDSSGGEIPNRKLQINTNELLVRDTIYTWASDLTDWKSLRDLFYEEIEILQDTKNFAEIKTIKTILHNKIEQINSVYPIDEIQQISYKADFFLFVNQSFFSNKIFIEWYFNTIITTELLTKYLDLLQNKPEHVLNSGALIFNTLFQTYSVTFAPPESEQLLTKFYREVSSKMRKMPDSTWVHGFRNEFSFLAEHLSDFFALRRGEHPHAIWANLMSKWPTENHPNYYLNLAKAIASAYMSSENLDKAIEVATFVANNTSVRHFSNNQFRNWFMDITSSYLSIAEQKRIAEEIISRRKEIVLKTMSKNVAFTMYDIVSQKNIDLTKFRGKTTIIDVWASWCGPCIASIPSLNNLYKLSKEIEGLEFISIVCDEITEVKTQGPVKKVIKMKGVQYPVLWDLKKKTIQDYVEIPQYPTILLMNKNLEI